MDSIYPQYQLNRTIYAKEQEYLFFSGTAYLGVSASMDFSALIKEGLGLFGTSHGLSRINNVRLRVFEEFEISFAHHAGAQRAAVYSSGYLAGHAAVSLLEYKADAIFVAPSTHPAVLSTAIQKQISTSQNWIDACVKFSSQSVGKHILLIANAVDALVPKIHDFSWVKNLPKKNKYTLLIDDSHAFGTVGEDIFGTYKKWKDLPVDLVISGSLGKGLGLPAGIVLGNHKFITELTEQSIYRGASPPPPAYLWAFLKSQDLYKKQKDKLKDNIQFFKKSSQNLNLQTTQEDFPVFRFDDSNLLQKLQEHQIIISSFPYPSPNDPPVHRIVISAWHEKEDLLALIKVLNI